MHELAATQVTLRWCHVSVQLQFIGNSMLQFLCFSYHSTNHYCINFISFVFFVQACSKINASRGALQMLAADGLADICFRCEQHLQNQQYKTTSSSAAPFSQINEDNLFTLLNISTKIMNCSSSQTPRLEIQTSLLRAQSGLI